MLAVAIASTFSRALSNGTIHTTKLLRRGIDIDRAARRGRGRDRKITDVMRPFRPFSRSPLRVPSLAAALLTSWAATPIHANAGPR